VNKDAEIKQFAKERDKAKSQAILDAMQVEGRLNHINALRTQISLLKREKEDIRKEANKFMLERDELMRVLPLMNSLPPEKKMKLIRLNISDLFDGNTNQIKERNTIQGMISAHSKLLKSMYRCFGSSNQVASSINQLRRITASDTLKFLKYVFEF